MAWWLVAATVLCVARAQEAQPDVSTVLRAELQSARTFFTSDMPLRLRFTLTNTSDQAIVLPLEGGADGEDAVGLPLALIIGQTQPWLSVAYEGEPQRDVPPVGLSAEPTADSPRMLRLAPHGVIGAELDLQAHYPSARYPGSYRVTWRPMDGRLGACSVEFRVEPRKEAILVTDYGKVTFRIEYERAPRNVENFIELVRSGFYDGKTIHRVVPGFVLQGGCPKGDGTGTRPDGKLVAAEFHDYPVDAGTLLMARKPSDANSASCQFFVALARRPELDGRYTVIGQATDDESMRTLQALASVPCDARDRPLSPLVIRSINLVDAEQNRTLRLEVRSRTPTPAPQPSLQDH